MMQNIVCRVTTDTGAYSGMPDFIRGSALFSFPEGSIAVTLKKGILSGTVTAGSECVICSVSLTGTVDTPFAADSFLKNGFQSWSYSGAMGAADAQKKPFLPFVKALHENVTNIPSGKKGEHTSEMFCCIGSSETGQCILAAQQPPFNQYTGYRYSFKRRELTVEWDIGKSFAADEEMALDAVEFCEGDANELLALYADRIKKKMHIKFRDTLRTGWCSWYYYYTKIDADCILDNLAVASGKKMPFDFFQIDDGYQRTVGDWLTLTPGFEGRMREITDAIKKAGYRPGIWIAPFITTSKAPAFSRPGWVLKDKNGKPVVAGWNPNWGTVPDLAFYALDITHPEVREYIQDVIAAACRDWGFTYLKLDFMYAASLPGERYDMSMTRAEILKEGNLLIRKAAGKGTVLLGCGMPISAALGTMDAMRVSCDVSSRWGVNPLEKLLNSDSNLETRGAIRNSIVRSFMDKRLWINDPDCLMLRTVNTKLTAEERRSLYCAVMTIGGMVVVSDDLGKYGKEECARLETALALFEKTRAGKVTAPFILSSKIPEMLVNDRGYFSVFNFSERFVEKSFTEEMLLRCGINAYRLQDCESGKVYCVEDDLRFILEPHDAKMFRILK